MSIHIPNYTECELVHQGKQTSIYRAKRMQDGLVVILKILKSEYQLPKQVAKIEHEYEIIKKLKTPYVIHAYDLEVVEDQVILVLENCGQQLLSEIIREHKITDRVFLSLAIELAEGVGEIHRQNVIHKNINPEAVFVDLENNTIKLLDFSVATLLSSEVQSLTTIDVLEGAIAYISPEQTGRMNRSIDYRTDIYSLGILFYEMITNELPFKPIDLMDLIHLHLAQRPPSPHQCNPNIPRAISEIIMKCLSKDPEERYHSAYGLKNDLKQCLRLLDQEGFIKFFIPGQEDVFDHFQIPQKLYGRKKEGEALLSLFESTRDVKPVILAIKGAEGVGKTRFVNELQSAVARFRGHLIVGKFGQLKINVPYHGVIQAFQSLIQQLLVESDEEIAQWKEVLLQRLGVNAQLLIDLIPELEFVIGPQPAVAKINPQDAEVRLNDLFISFVELFLRAEHPLVLFLDDLQWMDPSSMRLLLRMAQSVKAKNLFVILAYRDHEVTPSSPLIQLLDEIKQRGHLFQTMEIKPLDYDSLNEWVCDALHCGGEQVVPLVKLIYQKTSGNPFFVIEFMKMLYRDGLLIFDAHSQSWVADLAKIKQLNVTENVAELMSRAISSFPEATQALLRKAAVIGTVFDLKFLSLIQKCPMPRVIADLWPALQQELILVQHNSYDSPLEKFKEKEPNIIYVFQHERIRKVLYESIPIEKRKELHLAIGRLLLQVIPVEKRFDKIIEIVNQLNEGVGLVDTEEERLLFASLNLMAGKKVKDCAAYATAIQYCEGGLNFLGKKCWDEHYDLSFLLSENLALCQYMAGDQESAEQIFDLLLSRAKTAHEKGRICASKADLYAQANRFKESLNLSIHALKWFGVNLSLRPSRFELFLEALRVGLLFLWKGNRCLEKLPEMHDKNSLIIGRLYTMALYPAFAMNDCLVNLIIVKIATLTLKKGVADFSPFGLICLSAYWATEDVGNYKRAWELGALVLQLAKKFPNSRDSLSASIVFYLFVNRWRVSFKENIEAIKEVERRSLEFWNFPGTTMIITFSLVYQILKGDLIDHVLQKIHERLSRATKNEVHQDVEWFLVFFHQEFCLCMQGAKRGLSKNYLEQFVKGSIPAGFNVGQINYINGYCNFWSVFLCYLRGDYQEVLRFHAAIEENRELLSSHPLWNMYYFYYALTLVELSLENVESQQIYAKRLERLHKKVENWAEASPLNYRHQFLLLSAELAFLKGKIEKAFDFFEEAIRVANENGFLHEEALAYELAAKRYLSRERKLLAACYFSEAFQRYARWGCKGKLVHLQEKYGELLNKYADPQESLMKSFTQSESIDQIFQHLEESALALKTQLVDSEFDILSILRALQTLSIELELEKLIANFMELVMVNSGAKCAFLILPENEQLLVKGEIFSGQEKSLILEAKSIDEKQKELCKAIVYYVRKHFKEVLLDRATDEGLFIHDPYIVAKKVQSILCMPLMYQGKLVGILYLENQWVREAFTENSLRILTVLTLQMAVSLENAMIYKGLKEELEKNIRELNRMQLLLTPLGGNKLPANLSIEIVYEIENALGSILDVIQHCSLEVQKVEEFIEEHHRDLSPEELDRKQNVFNELKENFHKVFDKAQKIEYMFKEQIVKHWK